jgi:digalactosyldiacylglycerol synthase
MVSKVKVEFYAAKYHSRFGSIFSTGPYVGSLPDASADICILEEPEHLSWFRYPEVGWMDKFKRVVGIMHTNYVEYARQERGLWAVGPVWFLNQVMCRAHCHRVVKLSGALQSFAPHKECVENVHGVRSVFFQIGQRASVGGFSPAREPSREGSGESPQRSAECYFLSKQLWAKGYRLLFDLMEHYRETMVSHSHALFFLQGTLSIIIKSSCHPLLSVVRKKTFLFHELSTSSHFLKIDSSTITTPRR